MRKVEVILLALILFFFVTYIVFVRIDWKLINNGNVNKIQKHLKFKSSLGINIREKKGQPLFNKVLLRTSANDNYDLVEFMLKKGVKVSKINPPFDDIIEGMGDLNKGKLVRLKSLGELLKKYKLNNIPKDQILFKTMEDGKEYYKILEILLQSGVNPNQKNASGETPLFYLIKKDYKYREELNIALNKLGLKRLPTNESLAELMRIDENGVYSTELDTIKEAMKFYDKPLKIMSLLNKYGANPNIPNKDGIMPLVFAVKKGDKEYIDELLKFKTKVDFNIIDNKNILFSAVNDGNFELINLLFSRSIDYKIKNENMETIPVFLIRVGKYDILNYLILNNYIDKKTLDLTLEKYIEEEDVKVIKQLSYLGIKIENLEELFFRKTNNFEKIDFLVYLLDLGISLDIKDSNGDTPIFLAVKNGNDGLFNLMLARHTDLNLTDIDGNTPLIKSLILGREDYAIDLINKGVKLNIKNLEEKDAFYYAKLKNYERVLNLLPIKVKKE